MSKVQEEHAIVEDLVYVPTRGGNKDSHICVGYHCTICDVKGSSEEEINKSPCKPRKGGE